MPLSMRPIRVLLVDDHAMFLAALHALLDHDDPEVGPSLVQTLRRLEAVHDRQLEIDQCDVRVQFLLELERMRAVVGLADDLDPFVPIEECVQRREEHRMVVDEQHAYRPHR